MHCGEIDFVSHHFDALPKAFDRLWDVIIQTGVGEGGAWEDMAGGTRPFTDAARSGLLALQRVAAQAVTWRDVHSRPPPLPAPRGAGRCRPEARLGGSPFAASPGLARLMRTWPAARVFRVAEAPSEEIHCSGPTIPSPAPAPAYGHGP